MRAFININDDEDGKRLIEKNINVNDQKHSIELKHCLIDFYAEFGDVDKAFHVFNSIPLNKRDIVTIAALMKCYINNGKGKKALDLYYKSSTINNDVSHVLAIKACINLNDFEAGKRIIAQNIDFKNNKHTMVVVNAIIDFYGHFGDIQSAQKLFSAIDGAENDAICVASMMKCLIDNNLNDKAILLFNRMGINNSVTNMLGIKACINTDNFEFGKKIIDAVDISKEKDVELLNTIIRFYGHFENISSALAVFDMIKNKTIDSVNCMIQCYCNNKHYAAALSMYDYYCCTSSNGKHNIKCDDITHVVGVTACINSGNFGKGRDIITELAEKKEINAWSVELQNAVITFMEKMELFRRH